MKIQISYHKKSIRTFTEFFERVYYQSWFFIIRSFTPPMPSTKSVIIRNPIPLVIFVKELKCPFQIHYDISSQNDEFPREKKRLRRTKITKPTNIIISVPNEVAINTRKDISEQKFELYKLMFQIVIFDKIISCNSLRIRYAVVGSDFWNRRFCGGRWQP